jgi:hypothetical protein
MQNIKNLKNLYSSNIENLLINAILIMLIIISSFSTAHALPEAIVIGVYGNNDRIQTALLGIVEGLTKKGESYTVIHLPELTMQNTLNLDILITDADLLSFNEETYATIHSIETRGVLFLLGNSSKFMISQTYPYIEEELNGNKKSYEFVPYYSLVIRSEKLYTLEGRIYSESPKLFSEKIVEIVSDELFQSIFINTIPSSVSKSLCGEDWIVKAWYVYMVTLHDKLIYKKDVAEVRGDRIICQFSKPSLYNWFLVNYKLSHKIYEEGYSCNSWNCGWFVEQRMVYSDYNTLGQRIHDFELQSTANPDLEIYAYVLPVSNIVELIEKLRGPDYFLWPSVKEPSLLARTDYQFKAKIVAYSPMNNSIFVIKDATDKVTFRFDKIAFYFYALKLEKYIYNITMKWPLIMVTVTPVKVELPITKSENQTKIETEDLAYTSYYLISPFSILLTIVIIVASAMAVHFLLTHLRIYKKKLQIK